MGKRNYTVILIPTLLKTKFTYDLHNAMCLIDTVYAVST